MKEMSLREIDYPIVTQLVNDSARIVMHPSH